MSPYIRAYEAGVKLAQLDWMSKIADPQNATQEPAAPQPTSEPTAQPQGGEDTDFLSRLREIDRNYLGGYGSRLYDSVGDYFSGNTEAPQANLQLPDWGSEQGEFSSMMDEPGRTPYRSVAEAPTPQVQQGLGEYNYGKYTGLSEAGRGDGTRFDYMAQDQSGMVDPDARFNVQHGNYRKQFNRFRDQFGGGQDDAFSGLNYKDFAGALGNRGLQVGDSLNANDIMSRLQSIRQNRSNEQQGLNQGPMDLHGGDSLEIQNRRGNTANRGSLAQQQAAAARRSNSVKPVNMPNNTGVR